MNEYKNLKGFFKGFWKGWNRNIERWRRILSHRKKINYSETVVAFVSPGHTHSLSLIDRRSNTVIANDPTFIPYPMIHTLWSVVSLIIVNDQLYKNSLTLFYTVIETFWIIETIWSSIKMVSIRNERLSSRRNQSSKLDYWNQLWNPISELVISEWAISEWAISDTSNNAQSVIFRRTNDF